MPEKGINPVPKPPQPGEAPSASIFTPISTERNKIKILLRS